jgi:hypothetical protein
LFQAAYKGIGKHFWDVPTQNYVSLAQVMIPVLSSTNVLIASSQVVYVTQILYVLIQNITKFSILFLYLRIFPTPHFRRMVKLSIGWMVCHTLVFLFAVVFQCLPISSLWNREIKAQCLSLNHLAWAGAAFSIFEDLAIILLPAWELKALSFSLGRRIGLAFMFALGSL